MEIDIDGLNALHHALADVIGYLSDNSCGDPDCCGGPFYELDDYERGKRVLAQFGLTLPTRLSGDI